jgi:hypothetical protein
MIAAVVLAGCSDSTAPDPIQLTEAQAEDLMAALATIGSPTGLSQRMARYRQGDNTALITITVDEQAPCPDGGTYRVQGTLSGNDAGTEATISTTQSYANCKATSDNDVLWTFNGAPNIQTSVTMTSNPTTGAFSLTGTQQGAIDAASTLGTGRCAIDLTYSFTGNEQTETGTISVSGSVCGRNVTVTVTE